MFFHGCRIPSEDPGEVEGPTAGVAASALEERC